jgi:Cys-tRNA(Pro)/Cys-tRNA(Cys) deacylase
MAKGTPATSALEKAGVAFTLHEYDYDPDAERVGMQAAASFFKLIVRSDGTKAQTISVPAFAIRVFSKRAGSTPRASAACIPTRSASGS